MLTSRRPAVRLSGFLCVLFACADPAFDDRIYVTSGLTDEIIAINPQSGEILERFAVDVRRMDIDEPHGIAESPDRNFLYVTLAHGEPALWKLALPSHEVVSRTVLGLRGAARVGISPDGRRAFVPDYDRARAGRATELAVIDTENASVIEILRLCSAPHHAEVSASGRYVAVTCSMSDEIVVLDGETLVEQHRFFVDSAPGPPGAPVYKPLNLTWSSDDRIYVGLHNAAAVAAFTVAGRRTGFVQVGDGPAHLTTTSDERWLIVPNRNSASVSVVSIPDMSERSRFDLDVRHPRGAAVSPNDSVAFISFEGDTRTPGGVLALDLIAGTTKWRVDLATYALGVVYVRGR